MQKDILTCMHKYLNSNLRPVVGIWQYPCLFLFPFLGAKSKLKTLVFKLFLMSDRQSELLHRKGSRDTQNWIYNISMLKCLKSMRLLLYILLSCLHVLSQMFKPKEISDLMQGNSTFHLVARRYNFQERAWEKKSANVTKCNTNKTTLHLHSLSESDGSSSPTEAVERSPFVGIVFDWQIPAERNYVLSV